MTFQDFDQEYRPKIQVTYLSILIMLVESTELGHIVSRFVEKVKI